MKTRTLFLTLLISISILLITNGLAFAEPITGCIKRFTGIIYNVQIGTEPKRPCRFGAEQITWNQEGPQGPAGADGQDGQDGADGQDGTIIHQVHLEDSNNTACENATGPPTLDNIGWCPNGFKNQFIIHDPMITPNSVVMANLGALTVPFQSCQVQFINPFQAPTAPGFNFRCDVSTPGPPDGRPLNYVIINPPPAP